MRALGRLMLLLCFAAAMAACDHRELCYDHSHWVDLTVDFDWSEAPDARPSTMVVILFPADGSEGRRSEQNPRAFGLFPCRSLQRQHRKPH